MSATQQKAVGPAIAALPQAVVQIRRPPLRVQVEGLAMPGTIRINAWGVRRG